MFLYAASYTAKQEWMQWIREAVADVLELDEGPGRAIEAREGEFYYSDGSVYQVRERAQAAFACAPQALTAGCVGTLLQRRAPRPGHHDLRLGRPLRRCVGGQPPRRCGTDGTLVHAQRCRRRLDERWRVRRFRVRRRARLRVCWRGAGGAASS